MRWFIVLLLLSNLVLFFWLQHDSLPDDPVAALPPPDVGRLQLLKEEQVAPAPTVDEPGPEKLVEPVPAQSLTENPADGPSAIVSAEAPADEPAEDTDVMATPITEPTPSGTVTEPGAELETGPDVELASRVEQAPAKPDLVETVDPVLIESLSPDAEPVEEEKAPVSAVAPATEVDVTSLAVTQPSCALIGPMDAEAADALLGKLPAFVVLLSDMTVELLDVDGYYVMIPPLPSRADGLAMLARLEAEGITDTWLFPRGVYRNAISLGLFTRRAGAERHLRNVVAQGFEAELIEKGNRTEQRQLLVKNVDGGDVALSLPLPEGVAAEQRDCP